MTTIKLNKVTTLYRNTFRSKKGKIIPDQAVGEDIVDLSGFAAQKNFLNLTVSYRAAN